MAAAFLEAFPVHAVPLLVRLAPLLDDNLLLEIAGADYGFEAEANFSALQRLRDARDLATLRAFSVREVLALTRWAEPDAEDDPDRRARVHRKRAFSCAALLHYACEPEGADVIVGTNDCLGPLIDSMTALDLPWHEEAAGLVRQLVHRLDGQVGDDELAFFGVALIWFGLQMEPPVADEVLTQLCVWTAAREQAAAHLRYGSEGAPERWLLSSASFPQRNGCWSQLGHLLQAVDLEGRSAEAQDWVRLIGRSLAGI